MKSAAWAEINLTALTHNLNQVRAITQHKKVLAVIKANAYGHGLEKSAHALKQADGFAVARLSEAIQLYREIKNKPILILSGFQTTEELTAIASHQFHTVIHNEYQIELLESSNLQKQIHIWLKLDTGMHRLGIQPEKFAHSYPRLTPYQTESTPMVIMTHLGYADDKNNPQTHDQVARFQNTIPTNTVRSIANSAGILGWPETHSDWVRPGIMLYGASPFTNSFAPIDQLQPVMTLFSKLIAINHHKKNAAIGYGGIWHCPEDMPVGIVSIGYGDGYPRHAQPGTPILINNVLTQLIGRVSMDMICIDLRNIKHYKVGDTVTLWGNGLPIENIARNADTISYELLCNITQRVQKIYYH